MSILGITPRARRGVTEEQAIDRLIRAAEDIAKGAVWCNLSRSKISGLRAPLAELKLARRTKNRTAR